MQIICTLEYYFGRFATNPTNTLMAKVKYDRGRQIHYDRIPDDVYDKILEVQKEIKKKTKRGKVSMSDAITKLIRGI